MSVNLRYENGGIGTMTLGTGPILEAMVFVKGTEPVRQFRYLRRGNCVVTVFRHGSVLAVVMRIHRLKNGISTRRSTASADRVYLEEMQHWAASLQAGTQPHSSLEDAYQNMRVLEAISRSIETGEVVQIPV